MRHGTGRLGGLAVVGAALLVGIPSLPARASHTTFSYTASRFELSGAQGSFVDDFSDGVLSPWLLTAGTAVDSGNGLVVSNPGTDTTVESPFYSDTEYRDVSQTFLDLGLADGNGDFLMESRWTSGAPLEDQLFVMSLGLGSAGTAHAVSIALLNLSPELASRASHPIAPGTYALFADITIYSFAPNVVVDQEADPTSTGHMIPIVNPFAGDAVLRLVFDDQLDEISASFSLDGGSSFDGSLAPFTLAPGWLYGGAGLGADPFEVAPEPATAGLVALGLVGLAVKRRRRREI